MCKLTVRIMTSQPTIRGSNLAHILRQFTRKLQHFLKDQHGSTSLISILLKERHQIADQSQSGDALIHDKEKFSKRAFSCCFITIVNYRYITHLHN